MLRLSGPLHRMIAIEDRVCRWLEPKSEIEQVYAELAKQQAHLQFALMDLQQQQQETAQRRRPSKGNLS